MSINIVALNVESVTQKVIVTIAEQYKESLINDDSTINKTFGGKAQTQFDEIINKQTGSWFLKYLLS